MITGVTFRNRRREGMTEQHRNYRNLFNGVIASTLRRALGIVADPHSFIFPAVGSAESTFR
jgi:hypothetical protein